MQHYWSLDNVNLKDTWLTIGSFDGVHLGHQAIINRLTESARREGATTVVITFHPHPAVILGKRDHPFYLTSPEERAEILGHLGVDSVITHRFDKQVASTSAQDFISRLSRHLGMTHILVGHDFALGKNREGNVPKLTELGKEFGYEIELIPPVKIGNEVVSSNLIRKALMAGDVEQAGLLLGRPYLLRGEVISGDGRGRSIGIPTANLKVWAERAIPKEGVYVCQVVVNGRAWGAVTNVGVRPTFEPISQAPLVETHILDFDSEIYGEAIDLKFLSRLRDERRFPNPQALVDQIQKDILYARQTLALLPNT